eukprot:4174946-Prymnesium_polylepis.1
MIWPFASRCGGRGCRGRMPGPPRRPSLEPGGAPRRPSPAVSMAYSRARERSRTVRCPVA